MFTRHGSYPLDSSVPFAKPSGVLLASSPPSIEHPQSLLRILVECCFYLLLVVELFASQLGLSGVRFLAGGLVAGGGLFCFFAYHFGREQLPTSFYFILGINFFANFSVVIGHGDTPILGDGLTELFHWITYTLLLSYLVRNRLAEKRVLFFMAVMILMAVVVGGVEGIHFGRPRLQLEQVGGNFKNANDLAYFAGLIAVALLFRAFQSHLWGCIIFCLTATSLILVCAKTVSRGGTLALCFGLMMFFTTVAFSKSKFRSYVTVGAFLIVLTGLFLQFSEPLLLLVERLGETSYDHRVGVYQAAPIEDMLNTFIIGMGQTSAVTSEGISAHNSFLHTHIAYGGVAAYIYLAWVAWLGCGVWKCWFGQGPNDVRVFIMALFVMVLISHFFSNRGYLFLSSIYAAALIEKYTLFYRVKDQLGEN